MEPEPKPARKPRGRPRQDAPGSAVTTWLRQAEHDRLIRLARERDLSLSALVRSLLTIRPRP